jgi:anhydro-N-acetylmuramic acid kinase
LFGELFFQQALLLARRRRLSNFDFVATLTEFTARSIAESYRRHLRTLPQTVVLSGGGASNPGLVAAIRIALRALESAIDVITSAERGWPVQSIEPAAFAYLAWLRLRGQPGNIPETTGARAGVLCGQVSG